MDKNEEKRIFLEKLKKFAEKLPDFIEQNGEWTIKGFIDVNKNIYSISSDTKVISKIIELHLFPYFLKFAEENGYELVVAEKQNWYPDITFISKENRNIKFAVDLKTTYRLKDKTRCNGFTLGSHGEYFINRSSEKNIQYPYNEYSGHFCVGIIYTRKRISKTDETKIYNLKELKDINSVIGELTGFAQEKWRIAGDIQGSGNTANIGSINCVEDIINGNGVFAKVGEAVFDDYWVNYGRIQVPDGNNGYKPMTLLEEYLMYKGLPSELSNKSIRRKMKNE